METAEKKKFTFKDGTSIYLFAILGNLGFQVVFGFVSTAFGLGDILSIDWVSMLMNIMLQVVFFFVVFFYCRRDKSRVSGLAIRKVKPVSCILGGVVAVVCMFCFYLTAVAFQLLLDAIGYKSLAGFEFDSPASIVLGIIGTCLLAPVMEEIVCRGALLSGLRENYKPWAAVLICGGAFSLMHMNPEQTVYQFLLGCALALLALYSDSVIPAVVGHAVSNMLAITMELVTPIGEGINGMINFLLEPQMIWLYALLTVVLFIVGVIAVFFLTRLLKRIEGEKRTKEFAALPPAFEENGEEGEKAEEKAPVFKGMGMSGKTLLIIGMVACAVMWLAVFAASMIDPELIGGVTECIIWKTI